MIVTYRGKSPRTFTRCCCCPRPPPVAAAKGAWNGWLLSRTRNKSSYCFFLGGEVRWPFPFVGPSPRVRPFRPPNLPPPFPHTQKKYAPPAAPGATTQRARRTAPPPRPPLPRPPPPPWRRRRRGLFFVAVFRASVAPRRWRAPQPTALGVPRRGGSRGP